MGWYACRAFAVAAVVLSGAGARADNILVLRPQTGAGGPSYFLDQLGHNVTDAWTPPQSYAGYDQVWDMRYDVNLTGTDISAMGAYLRSGGRMFLTGEHPGYDPLRNSSLAAWISGVGGGAVGASVYENRVYTQTFTAKGQALVNLPNSYPGIDFNATSSFAPAAITQGFAVTVTPDNGRTSLVGWDLGDITGAPNARMLICWDVDLYGLGANDGQGIVENFHRYLSVPAPAGVCVLAGALAWGARRRRGRGDNSAICVRGGLVLPPGSELGWRTAPGTGRLV